jgi:hypothetical protein
VKCKPSIKWGCLKWRRASNILCDTKVPLRLEGKFYRTTLRLTMLYAAECWEVKNQYENKISVAEMRMLRWIRDRIRQDMITLKRELG